MTLDTALSSDHGTPTAAQWLAGSRPRTLPAAVAPILVGTGAAAAGSGVVWWKAALALVVALAMQVGVNYANDYSDGVRGTDAVRVGPFRLVGSGAAAPAAVRAAAFLSFGVAGVAGLALAATTTWWLVLVGAVCVLGAWFYTGGPVPYGYRGLGEISVFVFFGLVATVGTAYVQTSDISAAALLGGVAIGALACALLVANNLRDLANDALVGKRTLAVLLGDRHTRQLYVGLLATPLLVTAVLVLGGLPRAGIAVLAGGLGVRPARAVAAGAAGTALIPVLAATGMCELAYAALLAVGLAIS